MNKGTLNTPEIKLQEFNYFETDLMQIENLIKWFQGLKGGFLSYN